ncbi:YetF domain-containing protein [Halalkalibacter alkalisediminis]|uniref:YetF domain-containing protein n=1 Tax=Halalkalibacter alkalisediminis TaxID=935616 RepID=UPI002361F6A4|nr:YetF domain-containing protein [Halalkalibacter alkalisediminis]
MLDEHMRKQKYTIDALNQALRQKGIFDIKEVKYAVLEVSGQLSVQKKAEHLPLTQKNFYKHSSDEIKNFPVEAPNHLILVYKLKAT